jgi:riboflavin kinase/FMN adenylyltransferase
VSKKVVVTIGVFDGVHRGHIKLIQRAREIADENNAILVAASFDPHPFAVLHPEEFLGLLTLPTRRTELLKQAGVDRVEYLHFDDDFRRLTPDQFIDQIIVDQLGADVVVIGSNFRFGQKAAGDFDTLKSMSNKYGYQVIEVNLAGDSSTFSSTRVRNALIEGDVKTARKILGRPHRLTGEVVHGDHRGRELGFPTANLDVPGDSLIPADGVYSGQIHFDGQIEPVAVSVGTNPTFDGVIGRRVEAHIMGRTDLDLYGLVVDFDFIDRVRQMVKFDGLDALISAMKADLVTAKSQIADFLDSANS